MEWIAILVAIIFSLLGLVCIFTIILGLPGSWIMIGMAVVIELVDSWYLEDGASTFGWWILIISALLAGIGELLEFFAGMLGAKKAGSSRRGLVGSLIGGIVGGILGIAIPIPFFGPLIGAALGTFAGALLGEFSHTDAKLRDTLKPATGATIGRILGTMAKLPFAFIIWFMLTLAAFWL